MYSTVHFRKRKRRSGTVTVNSAANPKTIDLIINSDLNDPSNNGKTVLGLYQLSGTTLSMSIAQPGVTTRPASLSSAEGTSFTLIKQF